MTNNFPLKDLKNAISLIYNPHCRIPPTLFTGWNLIIVYKCQKKYAHHPYPKKVFFCLWNSFEVPLIKARMKCCWSAIKVPTATHLPQVTPSLSTVCWCKVVRFSNLRKRLTPPPKTIPFFLIVWSEANIRNRSSQNMQVVGLQWHGQTHRQTDGNGNSITYPFQRPNSVNPYLWACDGLNEASFWIDSGNYLMKKF